MLKLEEGISHLPLLDPSMRATPLTPSQWRSKLKAVNKKENSSSAVDTNCILLDVRNGTIYPSVVASDPLANVDKEKTDILMQKGFKRLYTLKGGVSHYLENEGSDGWVGNLFVFDGRLSLPPSTYKPEINDAEEQVSYSFAKCYICASQVSELRHRNCANLDCNLLFL
ncbi:hypothetical protein RD792_004772 [Penstemon davidsonii]|uniref:Rhodanase C-terminal domain-containing protein n=1 Tax=Penstemon davidsonii TaxID=160366 RepID=A0ABR0DJE2_9LAMI|nr:hypothetical protein RD792_004772 [Penstemon davidsonii]